MNVVPIFKNGRVVYVNKDFGGKSLGVKTRNGKNLPESASLELLDEVSTIQRAAFYATKNLNEEFLRLRRRVVVLERLLAVRTRERDGANKAHRQRLGELRALRARFDEVTLAASSVSRAKRAVSAAKNNKVKKVAKTSKKKSANT